MIRVEIHSQWPLIGTCKNPSEEARELGSKILERSRRAELEVDVSHVMYQPQREEDEKPGDVEFIRIVGSVEHTSKALATGLRGLPVGRGVELEVLT